MPYEAGSFLLLDNAAVTGPTAKWPGGRGVFSVPAGTFSGATVELQWRTHGTTWLDVDRSGDTFVTFTAAGAGLFELPPCEIRALVVGGTPSGLYAYAETVLG